jgi:hypothetical protein
MQNLKSNCNLLVQKDWNRYKTYWMIFFHISNATRGFEPISYCATEHSSTCHCIRLSHNLLNVLVQIANKMGLQKNNLTNTSNIGSLYINIFHTLCNAKAFCT